MKGTGIMGSTIFQLLKQTAQEYSEDEVPQLAAALAYYTIFSLAPLLVLVVSIAGMLFDQQEARQALLLQMRNLVGADGAEFLQDMMENANREGTNIFATIAGIVAMLFGATGVFVALQQALNRIWGAPDTPINGILDFIRRRFLSFTLILGVGFLLLVSLVLNTLLAALGSVIARYIPGSELILMITNWAISFLMITILFAMMFKILPDVKIRWRDVWVGAAVTTILFILGREAIGLYLGNSAIGSTYGAAGALALLLVWIYYSSQVLLTGAEFTQVWARKRSGSLLPDKPKKLGKTTTSAPDTGQTTAPDPAA